MTPAPLRAWLAYFLRLGTLGFGGPIALAGYMQRDAAGLVGLALKLVLR